MGAYVDGLAGRRASPVSGVVGVCGVDGALSTALSAAQVDYEREPSVQLDSTRVPESQKGDFGEFVRDFLGSPVGSDPGAGNFSGRERNFRPHRWRRRRYDDRRPGPCGRSSSTPRRPSCRSCRRGRTRGTARRHGWRRRFGLSMSETMSQRPSGPLRRVRVNFPMSSSPCAAAKPPMM